MNSLNTLPLTGMKGPAASSLVAGNGAVGLLRSMGTEGTFKGGAFSDALAQQTDISKEDDERAKQADEGAAGLVSAALILPILKQVRRSTFGEDGPFSPGTGEKTFGPQFDMQLADRIAHSPRLGIKNALAARMLKKGPQAAVKATGLDVHG